MAQIDTTMNKNTPVDASPDVVVQKTQNQSTVQATQLPINSYNSGISPIARDIQSSNFKMNSSGWKLSSNGSAEFNSISFGNLLKTSDGQTSAEGLSIEGGDITGTNGEGGGLELHGGSGGSISGLGGTVQIVGGEAPGDDGGSIYLIGGYGTDAFGDIIIGRDSSLVSSATCGFVYIPASSDNPSSTPGNDGIAGFSLSVVPMIFDKNHNKLWIYNGGWLSADFT